jgi:hypothetical protein
MLGHRWRAFATGEDGNRFLKADTVEMHHQVNDAATPLAPAAEPGVLAQMDGEPVWATALPSIATDRACADKLEPDPPQFDAAAEDFIGYRHSTGAGDGCGVEVPSHDAPPSTSGSSR